MGLLLHESGRVEEALVYFNLYDKLQPDQVATLQMRALVLHNFKRFEEALTDIRRAHALDPANARPATIPVRSARLGRERRGAAWFDRASRLRPDFVASRNKAFALANIQRFTEAFAVYDQSRRSIRATPKAELNLSLLQMLTGKFEAGWAGREARSKVPGFRSPISVFAAEVAWQGTIAARRC